MGEDGGPVEGIRSRVRSAFGALTFSKRVGAARLDEAVAQREAAEREAQAERARAEAAMHAARERSEQQG